MIQHRQKINTDKYYNIVLFEEYLNGKLLYWEKIEYNDGDTKNLFENGYYIIKYNNIGLNYISLYNKITNEYKNYKDDSCSDEYHGPLNKLI